MNFLILILFLFLMGVLKHFIHDDKCCVCGKQAERYDFVTDDPYCRTHSPIDKK